MSDMERRKGTTCALNCCCNCLQLEPHENTEYSAKSEGRLANCEGTKGYTLAEQGTRNPPTHHRGLVARLGSLVPDEYLNCANGRAIHPPLAPR